MAKLCDLSVLRGDGPLLRGLGLFEIAAAAARLPLDFVTVTVLGTPSRATIGLVVFVLIRSCCAFSTEGIGGVLDRKLAEGLFLPFTLTATGFALPRMAVCAGSVLTTALPL